MRRKQKNGIYSNQTIKSCSTCTNVCLSCKSICKVEHGFSLDDSTISKNHPILPEKLKKNKKLHHHGVGSLNPGCRFIYYCRRSHRYQKISDKEWNTKHTKINRFLKFDLSEQIIIYEIST